MWECQRSYTRCHTHQNRTPANSKPNTLSIEPNNPETSIVPRNSFKVVQHTTNMHPNRPQHSLFYLPSRYPKPCIAAPSITHFFCAKPVSIPSHTLIIPLTPSHSPPPLLHLLSIPHRGNRNLHHSSGLHRATHPSPFYIPRSVSRSRLMLEGKKEKGKARSLSPHFLS